MKVSAISFRGYDQYPVNGGNVEKLEYEVKHGTRDSSDNQAVCDDTDRKKTEREYEIWAQTWLIATGGLD